METDRFVYSEKRTINIGQYENIEIFASYGWNIKNFNLVDKTVEIFHSESATINEEKEALKHRPEQLICPKCASNVLKGADYGNTYCKKHKEAFIDYKCRYCCSVALFFCFGSHHFCDPCHRKAWELRNKKEKELK